MPALKPQRSVESLYDEATQLPESERRILAERLLDSLESEPASGVERAWGKEAVRRLDDVRAGRSQPAPWSEARARIFAPR
jgi:putative addiction module component (TIGR02574 family)